MLLSECILHKRILASHLGRVVPIMHRILRVVSAIRHEIVVLSGEPVIPSTIGPPRHRSGYLDGIKLEVSRGGWLTSLEAHRIIYTLN